MSVQLNGRNGAVKKLKRGKYMTTPMIVFVIAYVAVTISYFFSETSGNFKRRAVNKIFLASMFLIYATVEMFRLQLFGTLQLVAFIGLIFAYIGDVWLLWDFMRGGISFAIGNVILFTYLNIYYYGMGLTLKSYWWFVVLLAILVGGFSYLANNGWYEHLKGKMIKKFTLYITSVSLHGTLGLVGLFYLHDMKSILLLAGLFLFMVSDYFISLHKFKYIDSKAILRCNSGTYFIGLMLVALSFSF